MTFKTTGTFTIAATYGGDPNFTGSAYSASQAVTAKPTFTSARATTAKVGKTFSFKITTAGYPLATVSLTGKLPKGVRFVAGAGGTATITGTPATGTGGVYKLALKATSSAGSATQSFLLTVDQAPAITSAKSASATVGKAFTFKITTTGYPLATLHISGTLPRGLKFASKPNGTAVISGTPAPATRGMYKLTFKAVNAIGLVTQRFVLTVVP